MSNTEFDISMHTWLSGNGENYKVLRLSRFGKQYSVWVQDYVLNDYPDSLYDAYYVERGDATLHEIFTTKEEAMEVAAFVVDHYKMKDIENSIRILS
jgi:hypothetical protein